MNIELIEDFLNQSELKEIEEIQQGNKVEVLGWSVQGSNIFIEVNFYLCGEYKDIDISLFDLISFVYSKVSV